MTTTTSSSPGPTTEPQGLLRGATVLVTGAIGGMSQELVTQVLQRGAAAVYASARSRRTWQDPRVTNLHFGYTDTPMTRLVDAPKNDPADVVRAALDGLEAGRLEVLADELAAQVKQRLAAPVEEQYPSLAA